MAAFWKAMAGAALFTLSLSLMWWGAEGQGNGRDKKEVSGGSTFHLGQDRDVWRPLIHTRVNLSEIRRYVSASELHISCTVGICGQGGEEDSSSIKSTFQLRTFDPEGAIFYGDTKNGEDWFVLSLKDGVPLMQIKREEMVISVAGGPKINDGKWHTLEVSNQGMFVILEVDGVNGLVVAMRTPQMEEVMSGELRLALGGILIDKEKMIVQFEPQMDGCMRDGSWLNLSVPWETEAEELWPCDQNIQPGSYFPGTGFAIFNTSVFPIEGDDGVKIELWGDFTQMNGVIMSIKAAGHEFMFTLEANNNTQDVTLTFGEEKIIMKNSFRRLLITFMKDLLKVRLDKDESKATTLSVSPASHSGSLPAWTEGRLAIGGLLGEGDDGVGSCFLTGCLEKIRVEGRDLDLDLAVKHVSVSSHSCPA